MSGAPWLPLGPRQAGAMIRAIDSGLRDEGDGAVEAVLMALVGQLQDERAATQPADGSTRGASRSVALSRARRVGLLTGAAGALGKLPGDVLHQVEEARVLVDAAARLAPAREDRDLAADLLVLWGIVDDLQAAQAMTDPGRQATVLAHVRDEARATAPATWTARSTLRFVWDLRRARDVVGDLRPGLVRAIPVIGAVPATIGAHRDMKAWTTAVERHLSIVVAQP